MYRCWRYDMYRVRIWHGHPHRAPALLLLLFSLFHFYFFALLWPCARLNIYDHDCTRNGTTIRRPRETKRCVNVASTSASKFLCMELPQVQDKPGDKYDHRHISHCAQYICRPSLRRKLCYLTQQIHECKKEHSIDSPLDLGCAAEDSKSSETWTYARKYAMPSLKRTSI